MRGDEVIVEAGSEQSEDWVKWGTNNADESTYLIFFVENDAKTKKQATFSNILVMLLLQENYLNTKKIAYIYISAYMMFCIREV